MTEEKGRGGHGWWRLGVVAILVVVVWGVFRFTPLDLSDFKPTRIKDFILALGVWGPVVFIGLYALRAVVLVIPVGIMSLAGGLAFGKWLGTAYILTGAIAGSCLSFLVARYLGRRFLEGFSWLHKGRVAAFDEGAARHGFRVILLARLIPIFQYDALNFGAGLSRIKFRDYFLGTALGMLPGGFIIAFLGSSLENVKSTQFAVAIVMFAALVLVPTVAKLVKRRRGTAPGEAPAEATGHVEDEAARRSTGGVPAATSGGSTEPS
jgi:uncharacterized membrane protein YdjX (TVP38/TMEM64 family)